MRVHGDFSVDDKVISGIVKEFRKVVEATVANQINKLKSELKSELAEREAPTPSLPPIIEPKGIDLPESEKLRAADLRTALLLGKVPPDTGLLIDLKTTAKLLDVSPRTLHRLVELNAVPKPVKLGGLVRWQLADIIEWLDDGCPSERQSPQPRKNRR